MIEVLHVITSLEIGGAQRMLCALVERGDRARFAPRVVSLVAGGALEADLVALGVPVTSLGMRPGVPDPRALARLARLVGQRPAGAPPLVVQSWLYHADLLATAALRLAGAARRGVALAWNLRCTLDARGHGGLAARAAPRLCAWASRRPDVIVTNSEAGRLSHEAIGYRPRAWRWIPNGFDLERLRPDPAAGASLRAELGLGPEHVLVGMLARWHPMKEHALVLEAAAALAEELPEARFVLAGSGVERGAPAFERAFARAGAPAGVLALGARRDVPRLAAGLDLVVSASSTLEGFPNALGEALACGTPCLATDVGDSARLVGEAGRVVPAGDVAAWRAALVALVRAGPGERARLGALGRAHVRAHYALEAVVARYEEMWSELVEAAACAA